MNKSIIILLVLTASLAGCARKYQPLNLSEKRLNIYEYNKDGLLVQYDTIYNVFESNRRYSRKAERKDLTFIPVRITNTTKDTLNINPEAISILNGDSLIPSIPIETYYKKLKQVAWPYLLFIPLDFGYSGYKGVTYRGLSFGSRFPRIPVFSIYGIANFSTARNANKQLKKDLNTFRPIQQQLLPYESKNFILCINRQANNLILKYKLDTK
jgi:hypothetical protein